MILQDAEEKFSKKFTRIVLPIACQSLIAASLTLVDTLLVGQLGETEVAAVGFSTQFTFIFWMVLFGFTGGAITYISQFYGKGDMESIRRVIGIAAAFSFMIGVGFFCVCIFVPEKVLGIYTNIPEIIEMGIPFMRLIAFIFLTWSVSVPLMAALRATQQTQVPLKISIAVFSTNTILCILLINGYFGAPKMGIMGAAMATVVSRCLELIIYLIVIFGKKNIIAGPVKQFFSWTRTLFGRVIANSIPTMANETLWAAGTSLYLAAYGRMGITEAAAAQASMIIFNLFSLACYSVGDGQLIMCGEKLGQGKLQEAFDLGKKILRLAVTIGAIGGAGLIATSGLIVRAFRFSEQGLHYMMLILVVYGVIMFVKINNGSLVTGALRAGGDTRVAMFYDVGAVWFIGIPLAFLGALVFKLPIYWVIALVQLEEVTKFFFLRRRFFSKAWVKDLVRDL